MNGTYWSNISRCSLLPVCRHLTTLQARQAVHRRLELTSPSASTFLKARPAVSSNGNPARSGRSNRLILCLGSKQVSANKTGLSQPTGRGLPVALLITAVACQAFGVRYSLHKHNKCTHVQLLSLIRELFAVYSGTQSGPHKLYCCC